MAGLEEGRTDSIFPVLDPQEISDRFESRAHQDPLVLIWLDDLRQRQVITWEPGP